MAVCVSNKSSPGAEIDFRVKQVLATQKPQKGVFVLFACPEYPRGIALICYEIQKHPKKGAFELFVALNVPEIPSRGGIDL